MSKIVLNNVTSGYNLSTINSNFQKIEDEINNKMMSREPEGEPNFMDDIIDMNSNRIINLAVATNPSDAMPLGQATGILEGAEEARDEAVAAATSAALSASQAAASQSIAEAVVEQMNSFPVEGALAGALALPESEVLIGGTEAGNLYKVKSSFEEMVSNTELSITKSGQKVKTGAGVWKIVSYVNDIAIANTTPQLYAIPLNGIWLQDFGADPTATTDSREALLACWEAAPYGSTIRYGLGHYYISGQVTHPLKMLFHKGEGVALGLPYNDTSYQTGTALVFKDEAEDLNNPWAIYMPPRDDLAPLDTCRYSSFSDMSLLGDGVSDATGTRVMLKINNLGTDLHNFTTRYCASGIEVNYMVAAKWSKVNAVAKETAFWFRYDPLHPYDSLNNSVVTACLFDSVVGNCPAKLTGAIGWYVDATCLYGGNTHNVFNMESSYVGAMLEGRISSKDTVDFEALGAGSWRYSGNVFNNAWFEGNTQSNLIISYDPGETPPAIIINGLYQDVNSIIGLTSSLVRIGDTLMPLTPDINEKSQGSIGDYSSPFTSGQFIVSGPRVTTPSLTALVSEKVPHQNNNRANSDIKSSFEFDVFIPEIPLVASALQIASVQFADTNQSATVEVSMVGTAGDNTHHCVFGKYLATNTAGSIASVIVDVAHNGGGTQPFYLQNISTSSNAFGIFVWKDAATPTTPCTVSVKVTVSGSPTTPTQAVLTVSL